MAKQHFQTSQLDESKLKIKVKESVFSYRAYYHTTKGTNTCKANLTANKVKNLLQLM